MVMDLVSQALAMQCLNNKGRFTMFLRNEAKILSSKHLPHWIVKLCKKFLSDKMLNNIGPYIVFYIISNDKKLHQTNTLDAVQKIARIFKNQKESPAAAFCEIATFLVNSGHPDIAETYHELSLTLDCSASTYSLYLQGLLLNPFCTEKKMFAAAINYEKLFLRQVKKYQTYSNPLSKNRILNIGYICHFFHNCVAQSSLIPFLKAHNPNRVKIICYSDAEPCDVPEYIKKIPFIWRDTKNLDDNALASQIREDQIDILVELNGHIIVNRYLTIAKKPAPIQISYYNIATTTGISAIDYLIVGEDMCIDKASHYYTENIYKMKGVSGVIKFADDFPDVCLEPPSLKNNFITFGSFGGAQKVNKEVIKLWSKVLKKIPTSRFYMKAGVLTYDSYLKSYQKLFESEGIDLSRIHFEGFSEHREMLKCYANVDIALDTFPHGGGTTTMEASWQGVPVISLYGERQAMQHGKAILESIGHPELVAYSEEEFISKAVSLAASPNQLIRYRQELREDFRRSPKADPKTFANNLEDAYYDMWGQCKF